LLSKILFFIHSYSPEIFALEIKIFQA